jgi:uncharacterized protein (TIGR03118 family)
MLFSSWLRNWKRSAPAARRRTQTSPRQSASFRPRMEVLEDRLTPSTGYVLTNLVGYQPGIAHFTDPNLNGWGMTSLPNGSFAVANTFTTGLATFYDRSGHVLPQTITVPVEAAESGVLAAVTGQPISTQYGHPTGVVYNPTNDFKITENGKTAPATLIFDTLDGIICRWNPVVDLTHAIVLYDALADTGAPAVYTSLEIRQSRGHNVLYATDFLNNQLEVIGPNQAPHGRLTNINPIACAGRGVSSDPNSSVWSVSAVNDNLIVTFADLLGPVGGGGAVDVFNTDGVFQYQIDQNGPTSNVAANATGRLENPWGVTLAPAKFGMYSNDLLVGNVWGHGNINVYKPDSNGNYTIYAGQLAQPDGTPIAIKGLWDLEFGDGTPDSGKTNQLFFDAGPNHPGDSTGGLFGVIHAAGDQGGNGGGAPMREAAAPAQPVQQTLSASPGNDNRAPDLSAFPQLQAPAGNKVAFHAYAEGVQIYVWTGTNWAFVAPEATLYADAGYHGVVAAHYAGPTWESKSGSTVVGTRLASATADPDAIPWLLLKAKSTDGHGIFAKVTYIQRVNTVGGTAPTAPGEFVGDVVRVPYTAEYFFYRADA